MEKIVIITSNLTQYGGTERVAATLANGFVEILGKEVEVLNLGKNKGNLKYELNQKVKIKYVNIDNGNNMNKISVIKNMINIFKNLKNYVKHEFLNSDNITVIGIGTGISYLLPLVFKSYDYKLIGTQHNPISHSKISDVFRRYLINLLDKYVVLDEDMKLDIKNAFECNNIEVIPNPLTLKPNSLSNVENKNILAVGRLTYQKGFDRLIKCWEKVYKENPKWNLTIVGEGEDYNNLINLIRSKGLSSSISIKPFTEDINQYYENASIYTLTSRYEGFGLVLLEAQSHGLPVIAFNCPTGPRYIINNEIDGFLIDDGNIDEFSRKLNKLIKNENLRKRMSVYSIENTKRFSIDSIVEQWDKKVLKHKKQIGSNIK